MQIFEHNIPGLYAQYVSNLSISGFDLNWDPQLPDFFTNAIEVNEFENLRIDRFQGEAAFQSKDKAVIRLSNGKGFKITGSSLKDTDSLISRNRVTEIKKKCTEMPRH